MASSSSLAPSFLLSMPQLMDPNFSRTVVLLCKHSEEGAFGLVVNRPLVTTGRVTVNLDPPVSTDRELEVWVGGPVEPHRSWVLVGEEPDETEELRGMKIADGLYLSTSPDLLRRLLEPALLLLLEPPLLPAFLPSFLPQALLASPLEPPLFLLPVPEELQARPLLPYLPWPSRAVRTQTPVHLGRGPNASPARGIIQEAEQAKPPAQATRLMPPRRKWTRLPYRRRRSSASQS
jgi:hypothetical protein